ncbi:MAG TPA: dual specificity protein phosphatase family protein [Alphaproteobacteria bacterium]|nr:dual specificity protein phosphatase family protein [Alphaproteobacteria bacterium]
MTPPQPPRIWWIDEGRVAGSPNPTEDELKALRAEGFAAIVCLIEDEEEHTYRRAAAEALGYRCYGIPIRDHGAPTSAQFDAVLRILEAECRRGKVLVHCQGGSGRTGTLGAAYLVARGAGVDAAITKLREARPAAVETDAQLRSLRRWAQSRGAQ